MGILKNLKEIVSLAFLQNDFVKEFNNEILPKKNYQKETAENTAKILEELKRHKEKTRNS